MNDLKRKIILDLFTSPWTLIPFIGGISLLFLSRIIPLLAFPGFLGVLLGVGAFVTNVIFNLDSMANRALKEMHQRKTMERERKLDELYRRLSADRDQTDEKYLHNLRVMYRDFCNDVKDGKISGSVSDKMLMQVDQIFQACVNSLEHQFDILSMANKMQGDLRKQLLKQRKDVMEAVGRNIEELANAINHVRSVKVKAQTRELDEYQRQLARSLEVSQQIEDFASRAGADTDDVIDRYDEYLETPDK